FIPFNVDALCLCVFCVFQLASASPLRRTCRTLCALKVLLSQEDATLHDLLLEQNHFRKI
ncbi:hypothetical protein ILYODFUR_019064, partial [Ilyodon furcidens]